MGDTNENWLNKQNQQRSDYDQLEKPVLKTNIRDIFCSRNFKIWIITAIFVLVVPALIYYLTVDRGQFPELAEVTCTVKENFRVPCGRVNLTHDECTQLSCCFHVKRKECYHSLPSVYYYVKSDSADIYEAHKDKSSVGTKSVPKVLFSVNEDINIARIKLEVYNNATNPLKRNADGGKSNFNIIIDEKKLVVKIFRKDTKDLLLTTAEGPLIVSEKYLEWTLYLTNETFFGLNQTLIKLNDGEIFKKVLYKNKLDHYSIPVFWAYSKGKFHGVSIYHDGPLEITILPSNLVILRSLTLNSIEIVLDAGDTPQMLHDQLLKPTKPPPFWSLETHVCRAQDTLDLETIASEFKFDTISASYCIDEHLVLAFMMHNGTNTSLIHGILQKGKHDGKKFVLSLSPHVLADSDLHKKAEELDVLYKYNGTTYIGSYFNEEVVYPDYDSPNITVFIKELDNLIKQYVNVDIDGIILTDNWPSNDNFHMNRTDFHYFSEELEESMSFTLPWNSTASTGLHMDKHNSYGTSHLNAIKSYFSNNTSDMFIMSATKSLDQPEAMLIENVKTSWGELRNKLQNVLFESISGNHLVALPVCGDTKVYDPAQESLCIRWYLIAMTMPMFRVSSVSPWRDPENLNTTFAKRQALNTVDFRQQFLSYYYTILSYNEPVVRPMFYDFYYDQEMFKVDTQYMIGRHILVAHPFTSGRQRLFVYLPSREGIWYEMNGGKLFNSTAQQWINITIVENDFVAFLAQGTIIPLKDNSEINLLIAQNCSTMCEAQTSLLLENYVNFSSNDTSITISNLTLSCNYTLGYVKLYSYYNETPSVIFYNKNVPICNDKSSITIHFENLKEEEEEV